ncbi:hypothetical protein HDU98_004624 [Podochytrium sp. JEL0797]|nr:hypothetical protein HDU98_004624 [Podochytrium sp. JEL0797]
MASQTSITRLPASNANLEHALKTIVASSRTPFGLSFVGHLLFHRMRNESNPPDSDSRHLVVFTDLNSPPKGFGFVDSKERQQTSVMFWFDTLNVDASFMRACVEKLCRFAETVADPHSPNTKQFFFGFIEAEYIPLVKELCDLTFECHPHAALVFTASTADHSAGHGSTRMQDSAAIDNLNTISLPVGASFQVQDETFVMDHARLGDLDIVVNNNKYPYYAPYIERLLMDKVLGGLARVVRVVPRGTEIPEDLSTLTAVSWCFVHYGFSIGINWTMPNFRRKGLAVLCTAAVTKSYRDFMMTPHVVGLLESVGLPTVETQDPHCFKTVVPHCYTQLENVASVPMFEKIGYVFGKGIAVDWFIGTLKIKE